MILKHYDKHVMIFYKKLKLTSDPSFVTPSAHMTFVLFVADAAFRLLDWDTPSFSFFLQQQLRSLKILATARNNLVHKIN